MDKEISMNLVMMVVKFPLIFPLYWTLTKGIRKTAHWLNTDRRVSKRPAHLWWIQMFSPRKRWKQVAAYSSFFFVLWM